MIVGQECEENLTRPDASGLAESDNRPKLFRPLAWAVSFLTLPRFPSRQRRWPKKKRRRQFGPPTRCSLRLKGLPAEDFGDLPKTKRRIVQRKRLNAAAPTVSPVFEAEEEFYLEEEEEEEDEEDEQVTIVI